MSLFLGKGGREPTIPDLEVTMIAHNIASYPARRAETRIQLR